MLSLLKNQNNVCLCVQLQSTVGLHLGLDFLSVQYTINLHLCIREVLKSHTFAQSLVNYF